MKKLRVMTVIGTRPEIIRLSRTIACLDQFCDHIIVHTGQNYDYELNQIFFDDLEIRKPDHFLNASGKTSCESIAKIISKIESVLIKTSPDAMLVLGDTNSCLAAISAKKLKIPIFHMEAGNRCFDMRVPEEINRRIVDHVSDVNLTYSSIARDYLIHEGIAPKMIIKTGSPMREILNYYADGIRKSQILKKLNLNKNKYFLISSHREENIENIENYNKLVGLINWLGEEFNLPVIISAHPRTQKRIESSKTKFNKNISIIKPLGFKDYNKLQILAKVVLSDSGTISEESSILNFRALNIRESNERPEAMEESSVMMVGLEKNRIAQAINILEKQPNGESRILENVEDYKALNVSQKIVRIIHSYTDYINREVWKRY